MKELLIQTVEDLWDFIAYVVLYAPDEFPDEDYLPPDEQMTLSRAFTELENGLEIATDAGLGIGMEKELRDLLSESEQAYEQGNDVLGSKLLQDFEKRLFLKPR